MIKIQVKNKLAENQVKKGEEKKDHYFIVFAWIKAHFSLPSSGKLDQGFLGTLALLKLVLKPKSLSYMANRIFGCHVLDWK